MKGVWRYDREPESWLPVRLILTAHYNSAHYNHLHVEGIPKQTGTPPETNPGMPDSTREIYEAVRKYFPDAHIGVYNRRYIGGTTTWSQHSWSNALDIYAYGPAAQLPIYEMLTAPDPPEGGDELAHLSESEQLWLKKFIEETEKINSGPTFPRYLIPWFRKWRSLLPENFLKRGDKVDLI